MASGIPGSSGTKYCNITYKTIAETAWEAAKKQAVEADAEPECTCCIYGSEIDFKLFVNIEDVKTVCNDIWEHPKNILYFKKIAMNLGTNS